jgi:N-acetylneuraminic acid mutarotase
MKVARDGGVAVLLRGGKVLVSGGSSGSNTYEATAEIYDVASGTWSSTGAMKKGRLGHSMLTMPDGRALVFGGLETGSIPQTAVAEIESYDPDSGAWKVEGSLELARSYMGVLMLPSGVILLAGGDVTGSPVDGVELYEPSSGKIHKTSRMITGREGPIATLLPSGKVLVTGDVEGRTELYDPASHWISTAPARVARADHASVRFSSGEVLITGGLGTAGYLASVERLDPKTREWGPAGQLATARANHAATSLPETHALVTGGVGDSGYLASAERFDGTKWTPAGDMATARAFHTCTPVEDGALVVVAGGWGGGGALPSAEGYDVAANQWKPLAPMMNARFRHTAVRLADGRVLVAGGWGPNGALATAEIYDPQKDTWTPTKETMLSPRAGHTASGLDDGKVLVAGGVNNDGPLDSAEIFDPASQSWSVVATMLHARTSHAAAPLGNNRVLVAGGADAAGPQGSAEVYDSGRKAWLRVRPMTTSRRQAAVESLDGENVIVVGGVTAAGLPTSSAEIFTLESPGASCDNDADCQSGFCSDSVCCNSACDLGDCDGCSVLTGSSMAGACQLLSHTPCDDGDACTLSDQCNAGKCEPGHARDCGRYGCDSTQGECLHTCESVDDCASGNVCWPDGRCDTPPAATDYTEDTKCGVSPSGAPPGEGDRAPWRGALWLALAMTALAGRRRAAKASQRPGSRAHE